MKKLFLVGTLFLLLFTLVSSYAANAVTIQISWQLNSITENVTKYVVHRAVGINGKYNPVSTVNGKVNYVTVGGLAPGTYKFMVLAYNNVGVSPMSNQVLVVINKNYIKISKL